MEGREGMRKAGRQVGRQTLLILTSQGELINITIFKTKNREGSIGKSLTLISL